GFSSFMTPLMSSISTGRTLTTHPAQNAGFETGADDVSDTMNLPSAGLADVIPPGSALTVSPADPQAEPATPTHLLNQLTPILGVACTARPVQATPQPRWRTTRKAW